jgi:hypothetical protein
MTDLLSEFRAKKRACLIASLDLTPEQREKLDAAMDEPSISTNTIWNVVSGDWGVKVAANTISKHRRKQCTCD